MLDAGRRFFPMGAVLDLLDSMLAAKLNVLHLHASDECRFGVESKLFPNLTASLSGVLGGFYTQTDVKVMIAEAGARGIRVVPEFDVPGHSRGFRPVKSEGAVFCDAGETQSQLYGDPANSTLGLLQAVLKEMAELFEDDVFHIGCDETGVVGPCTTESTFELERHLLNYLEGPDVNKSTAGWEEILFDAGAATTRTIVYAWSRDTPAQVIAQGRRCVDSQAEYFYMTEPAGQYPQGWKSFWYGIGAGLSPAQLPMLLGGEMSMWTDTYCYISQCGASGGSKPVGAQLFPPEMDLPWSASVAGMIWPRGFVGAAAFWNFNASEDSQSADFVDAVCEYGALRRRPAFRPPGPLTPLKPLSWPRPHSPPHPLTSSPSAGALNDQVIAAGGLSCPTRCACDQLSACGVPYVPPPPPPAGTLAVQACSGAPAQQWTLAAGSGLLSSAANASLCVLDPGSETYPMQLAPCGPASSAFGWAPSAAAAGAGAGAGAAAPMWRISQASGDCVDERTSDGSVGSWECGSGQGLNQTNQNFWPYSGSSGPILSASGGCITAVL